jgi:hypothetical protein
MTPADMDAIEAAARLFRRLDTMQRTLSEHYDEVPAGWRPRRSRRTPAAKTKGRA